MREAIARANAAGGQTRIEFAIESGPATVRLASPLPPISFHGLIDGWTQPGYAGAPLVELTGADVEAGSGLEIIGGELMVRGLVVTDWPGDGIFVHDCDGVVLVGLYAGISLDGRTAAGNDGSGIHALGATRCVVGGPGDSTVVASGNGGYGILYDEGSDWGQIEGCFAGTDRTGRSAVPNQLSGVRVIQAGGFTARGMEPDATNVFSGNVQYGLEIVGPQAHGAVVIGNRIGSDVSGTFAVPNNRSGILVYSTPQVRIGGQSTHDANVISGNHRAGITVDGAFTELPEYPYSGLGHCHDNVVQGNRIGVDRTGELPLPNLLRGVLINHAQDNVVMDNIIGANAQDGVLVLGPGGDANPYLVPSGNRVLRNRIGVTPSGNPCGNGRHGVFVRHGTNNTIGGNASGDANVIAANAGRGVMFSGTGARSNVLSPLNELAGNVQGEFHQPRE